MESNNKLFVGGLPHSANENSLREHFNKYGHVKCSEIIKDRYTGRNRGFGFVTFSDCSSTETALAVDRHVIMGKEVDVKIATPKVPKNREPVNSGIINPKRIFVGGLPRNVTPKGFREYFASFGTIIGVEIPLNREDANKYRGFGYVTFDSAETVDTVLSVASHKIGDNTVEVRRATYPQRVEAARECLAYDSYNHGNGNGGMVAPVPYHYWCYGTGYFYPHMSFEYQDHSSYYNRAYGDSSVKSNTLDSAGYGNSQGSLSVRRLNIGEVRSCEGISKCGPNNKDKVSNSFNDTDKGKSVNINGNEGTSTNQEILYVQSSQYMKPDLQIDHVIEDDHASPVETILISNQIQGTADLCEKF